MREIKFRAWDIGRNQFIHPIVSLTPDKHSDAKEMWLLAEFGNGAPNLDVVYLQFTGLKDKNGKEIYEGDILKNKHNFGRVFWYCEMGAWAVFGKTTWVALHIILEVSKCRVIGNIYENPEMRERLPSSLRDWR